MLVVAWVRLCCAVVRLARGLALIECVCAGLQTAKQLVEAGALVVAADVKIDNLQTQVSSWCKRAGGKCTDGGVHAAVGSRVTRGAGFVQTCDVTREAEVEALVDACVKHFGRIDVMVANAGIVGDFIMYNAISEEDWMPVLKVNTLGVFYCVKHAAVKMQELGIKGSIVNTASVAGMRSGAGPVPYSASKAAVISITQVVANQLYKSGIRVNAVAPGLVETGMTREFFDAARERGTIHKMGTVRSCAVGCEESECGCTDQRVRPPWQPDRSGKFDLLFGIGGQLVH